MAGVCGAGPAQPALPARRRFASGRLGPVRLVAGVAAGAVAVGGLAGHAPATGDRLAPGGHRLALARPAGGVDVALALAADAAWRGFRPPASTAAGPAGCPAGPVVAARAVLARRCRAAALAAAAQSAGTGPAGGAGAAGAVALVAGRAGGPGAPADRAGGWRGVRAGHRQHLAYGP